MIMVRARVGVRAVPRGSGLGLRVRVRVRVGVRVVVIRASAGRRCPPW